MRVLLVIIQFPPDVNSTGLLMDQVCEGLRSYGHEVSVITTFPHYEKFRVWDEYRGKLFQRARWKGMDVLRLYTYTSGTKQRMAHRLLSYLSFNLLATVAGVCSRRRYDVILCTNGSFFSGLTAAAIGAAKSTPFVWNVQDLYPEVPAKTGQIRSRRVIQLLERLERFIYRRADHLAVITPSFRESLLLKGVPPDKITFIPNFVDVDFISPGTDAEAFRAEHGLTGKFVVMHAGNVGYVYDLETMLDAAARLRDRPDVVFAIVGDGVAKPRLEQKAKELALDNLRFIPFQPRERLPEVRAAADVQVSLYRRGSAIGSMPSKVYEIMASGRPLLASAEPESDVGQLVETTGCGLRVAPEDVDELVAAICRLRDDRELRDRLSEHGRQQAVAHYSKPVVVAQYERLLCAVAGRGRTSRAALEPASGR